MKIKAILLAAVCAAFFSTSAQAALELQLNTATKEFALFGSDTGTPESFSFTGITSFALISLGGSGFGSIQYDNDVAFSTSVGTPGNGFLGYDFRLTSSTANGGTVLVELGTSSNANQTLTGNGAFQSYASFPMDAIARLESTISQSITLLDGTASVQCP